MDDWMTGSMNSHLLYTCILCYNLCLLINISEEQNRQKEQPTNKGNGNQKSLGHLKGAKTIAR